MSTKGYDPACEDLARYFLNGEKYATEERIKELAQHIQDSIELHLQWIEDKATADQP